MDLSRIPAFTPTKLEIKRMKNQFLFFRTLKIKFLSKYLWRSLNVSSHICFTDTIYWTSYDNSTSQIHNNCFLQRIFYFFISENLTYQYTETIMFLRNSSLVLLRIVQIESKQSKLWTRKLICPTEGGSFQKKKYYYF